MCESLLKLAEHAAKEDGHKHLQHRYLTMRCVCVYVYMSMYMPMPMRMSMFLCLSLSLPLYVSVCLLVCVCVCVSVVSLRIYVCTYICMYAYEYVCGGRVYVCVLACLSVCLSVCLCLCSSACNVCMNVCVCVHVPYMYVYARACNGMRCQAMVSNGMLRYILVGTGLYWHVMLCTLRSVMSCQNYQPMLQLYTLEPRWRLLGMRSCNSGTELRPAHRSPHLGSGCFERQGLNSARITKYTALSGKANDRTRTHTHTHTLTDTHTHTHTSGLLFRHFATPTFRQQTNRGNLARESPMEQHLTALGLYDLGNQTQPTQYQTPPRSFAAYTNG